MQTGRADLDALLKVATIPSDEPVFILRAQDTEAADTVRAWAALHLADGGSEAVAESALQQAEAMDKWPIKKRPSPDHWSVPERLQLGFLFDQRAYRARGDAADLRIRLAEQRTFALARSQMRAFLSGPDARQILMLSNTKVHQIAEFFRETGEPIAKSYAAEQSFVLSWLMLLGLQHGERWRSAMAREVERRSQTLKTAAPAKSEVA